jgi:hypothetical protein
MKNYPIKISRWNLIVFAIAILMALVSCKRLPNYSEASNSNRVFVVIENNIFNESTGEFSESYWKAIKELPSNAVNHFPLNPPDKIKLENNDYYATGFYFSIVIFGLEQSDAKLFRFSNSDEIITSIKVKLDNSAMGEQRFISKNSSQPPEVFKSLILSKAAMRYKD